jgi:hypothetical protein
VYLHAEPKFKEDKSRKGFGKLGGLLQKKKKKRTRTGMQLLFWTLHFVEKLLMGLRKL